MVAIKARGDGAVEAAQAILAAGVIPAEFWIHGDDLCDCPLPQIGEHTNPYIAETIRYRLCCLLERLFAQHQDLVQHIPAYYDPNRHLYVTEPAPWDSDEMDMPVGLWYRALAKKLGQPLNWVREHYANRRAERPKKVRVRQVNIPTAAELAYAREEQLKAAGWLL